jgi:sulfur carrier protein
MRIVVNGSDQDVPERLTVAALVRRLPNGGGEGGGVAVAIEAQVVPRSEWEGVELSEGQRVEVLGAIQGG